MMLLSGIGLAVLVILVVVGAGWILTNVNFNETEKKEDTK